MTRQQANVLLVIVTISWGASYLFTKYAVAEIAPFLLVAYRFLLAFIVTAFIFMKKLRETNKETLLASLLLGIILCGVSTTFSYSLIYTSASTAAFVVSTTVILVPLIMIIITRKLPKRNIVIGVVITIIGLCLFTLKDSLSVDLGMGLAFASALLYAFHIIINNHFSRKLSGLQIGVYQLGFGGVFSLMVAFIFEPIALPNSTIVWLSVAGLAIFCSAFAVVGQSIAQKYTTAESTGFIFSLEPIFASIFAFMFLNEVMTPRELVGAGFIFIGVLVANYTTKKERNIKELAKEKYTA